MDPRTYVLDIKWIVHPNGKRDLYMLVDVPEVGEQWNKVESLDSHTDEAQRIKRRAGE